MNCPNCKKFVYANESFCSVCGQELPKENMKGTDLVECPVCGKRCKKRGIKTHIAGRARFEAFKNFKKKPHFDYYNKTL